MDAAFLLIGWFSGDLHLNYKCLLLAIIFYHVMDILKKRFVLMFAAGNEPCPQPQTSEHLAAIEIMQLKHIIIMQNKIDIVKESQAKDQYDQIVRFVQGAYFVNRH